MFLTSRRLARLIHKVQSEADNQLGLPGFSEVLISVSKEGLWSAILNNCHFHDDRWRKHVVAFIESSPIRAVDGVLKGLPPLPSFSKLMPGNECGEVCNELRLEVYGP